jgi:hypothetical protein
MKKMIFKLALLALPILTSAMPAQATTNSRMVCDAVISQANGNRLIYQLSGIVELADDGQIVEPATHSDNSPFTLTVQRRDRNNRRQTLLNRTPLQYYERIGPDADYSSLPFVGSFRGRPNDGREIYSAVGAAHGIWVSTRPVGVAPVQKQIQILHYLSRSNYLRSTPGTCRLVNL